MLVRIQEIERLSQEVEWLKELPLKVLIDRQKITQDDDPKSLVRQALRFFGVGSVAAWREVWEQPCAQFRGGEAHERHPGWVAAWIRLGELAAESVRCEPYSAQLFRMLLAELRSLTASPVREWIEAVKQKCSAAGVAVVFIKEIPGAGVSGVAKWLTKDKALIQLSLKYKTDDQLFFSFFHEAAHILLHSKRRVFLEDGREKDTEESEADSFAADYLIPPDQARSLPYLKSEASIMAFARMLGIAPGIIVGRMQHHDNLMSKKYCNHLKRKIGWAD
jgi:Zn-dependent peptidase ImmA (M78 family)